ncbi:MAG: hypothetical protein MJB14_11475 [Spirochaetes bacterium]|nr:hypothetical protein [Spirochaetota bacterium]
MEKIEDFFLDLSFSQIEAAVYLTLVKYHSMNGSQIAKLTSFARSSVYTALESLYQKGAVIYLTGEPRLYQAKPPTILFEEVKNKCVKSAEHLKKVLSQWSSDQRLEEFWNIKGMSYLLLKIEEMIKAAKKEILVNTNFVIKYILPSLKNCAKRGVRIIHFSFAELETANTIIEGYYNSKKTETLCRFERIMMVVDQQSTIVASRDNSGEIIGTFTKNPLFVNIISEHIHHDIYLYKLEEKFQCDLITPDIQINSLMEKLDQQSGDKIK